MTRGLTNADVQTWLQRYKQAWEGRDAELVPTLFTEAAHYIETPFDAPMIGHAAIRDYWQAGPVTGQHDIAFDSTLWTVQGDVALAHWTARFTRTASGQRIALDGVFRLTFAPGSGAPPKCTELREWWFRQTL